MPKSKKSDAEKATKDKPAKALKEVKPGKVKKEKKKAEPEVIEPKAAPKAVKKAAKPKAAAAPKKAVDPDPAYTNDDIALRAYFIAERRQAMGWPGDSTNDWVEAERQLKAEAARKAKL